MLTPDKVTSTPSRDTPAPGVNVRALVVIPRGATTGPYPEELRLGLSLTDRRNWQAVIEVRSQNGTILPEKGVPSHWLGLIPAARDRHEQNLEAVRHGMGRIVFRALKEIRPDEGLYVWYGDELAREMEVPFLTPIHIRGNQEYTCNVCHQSFNFPNTLKAHIMYHCVKPSGRRGVSSGCAPTCRQGICCRPLFLPAHIHPLPHKGGIPPLPALIHSSPVPSAFRPWASPESIGSYWPEKKSFIVSKLPQSNEISPVFARPPGFFTPFPTTVSPLSKDYSLRLDMFRSSDLLSHREPVEMKHEVDKHDENFSKGPVQMYTLPMPNEKAGEPIDLIPRSLYTIKSRKGHLCIYCGKFYSRKYGLKIHLRTHTGYKPLKCKVCLRPFGDPSNLNKHIRLHAEGDTPYRCEHCGKVLVRRRDLERHIKSRHPGQGMKPSDTEGLTQLNDNDKKEKDVKDHSDEDSTSDSNFECEDGEEIDILS